MKITMMSLGSTGDVRPYVILGKELKRRGHEVTIAAFSSFRGMVEGNGLAFFPIAGDAENLMNNIMAPGVKGTAYLREISRSLKTVAPLLLNDLLMAAEGADAMCCTFFGTMYYSVAEKYDIPCIQTHYFPMDPTEITPISSAPGRKLGKTWNLLSYRLGYFLIGCLEKKLLTDWRELHGLKLRGVHTAPDYHVNGHEIPVVYATSPQIVPKAKEWGDNIHVFGFWWEDMPENLTGPESLEAFIKAGEPPVYIGFGSMVSGNMTRVYSRVLRAVKAAKVRAVVDLGWNADKMHMKSTENVYFCSGVQHDWLFPQMKAVVHHGGAGTTATGLRHGKPTLIIPFGGDQPFWGERVYAMGCGPKPISR